MSRANSTAADGVDGEEEDEDEDDYDDGEDGDELDVDGDRLGGGVGVIDVVDGGTGIFAQFYFIVLFMPEQTVLSTGW